MPTNTSEPSPRVVAAVKALDTHSSNANSSGLGGFSSLSLVEVVLAAADAYDAAHRADWPSEAEVERAAQARYDAPMMNGARFPIPWSALHPDARKMHCRDMRAALRAIAPPPGRLVVTEEAFEAFRYGFQAHCGSVLDSMRAGMMAALPHLRAEEAPAAAQKEQSASCNIPHHLVRDLMGAASKLVRGGYAEGKFLPLANALYVAEAAFAEAQKGQPEAAQQSTAGLTPDQARRAVEADMRRETVRGGSDPSLAAEIEHQIAQSENFALAEEMGERMMAEEAGKEANAAPNDTDPGMPTQTILGELYRYGKDSLEWACVREMFVRHEERLAKLEQDVRSFRVGLSVVEAAVAQL